MNTISITKYYPCQLVNEREREREREKFFILRGCSTNHPRPKKDWTTEYKRIQKQRTLQNVNVEYKFWKGEGERGVYVCIFKCEWVTCTTVCVYVCVCASTRARVCVCVCVCVRERVRDRPTDRDKGRDRATDWQSRRGGREQRERERVTERDSERESTLIYSCFTVTYTCARTRTRARACTRTHTHTHTHIHTRARTNTHTDTDLFYRTSPSSEFHHCLSATCVNRENDSHPYPPPPPPHPPHPSFLVVVGPWDCCMSVSFSLPYLASLSTSLTCVSYI